MKFEDILNAPKDSGRAGSSARVRTHEKQVKNAEIKAQRELEESQRLPLEEDEIPAGFYKEGPLAGLYIDGQGMAWEVAEDQTPSLPLNIEEYPPAIQEIYRSYYARALESAQQTLEHKKTSKRARKVEQNAFSRLKKKRDITYYKYVAAKEKGEEEEAREFRSELQQLEIEMSIHEARVNEFKIPQDREEKRVRDRKKRAQRKRLLKSHLDPLKALVRGDTDPEISPIRLTRDLQEKINGLSIQEKVQVLNEYRMREEFGEEGERPLPGLTVAEKARDVYLVSVYFLKGVSVQEISLLLNVPVKSIKKILKRLAEQWASSALVNMDELRARELARIALVETEAWLSFERSQKTRESRQEYYEYHNGIKIKRREIRTSLPESLGYDKFLRIILDCIKLRSEILNLRAPPQVGGLGGNTTIQVSYVNDWRGSNFSQLPNNPKKTVYDQELSPAGQEILGVMSIEDMMRAPYEED